MFSHGPAVFSKCPSVPSTIYLTTWARIQTFRILSASACSDTSFSGGTTGMVGGCGGYFCAVAQTAAAHAGSGKCYPPRQRQWRFAGLWVSSPEMKGVVGATGRVDKIGVEWLRAEIYETVWCCRPHHDSLPVDVRRRVALPHQSASF